VCERERETLLESDVAGGSSASGIAESFMERQIKSKVKIMEQKKVFGKMFYAP
jgi:hypothetical protein